MSVFFHQWMPRRPLRKAFLAAPESLEQRLAFRTPNDVFMKPPVRVGDPPNPQWNMQKIQALAAWDLFGGAKQHVVAVMDYGIDYMHEDFGSSLSGTPGNLWDRGRVFANYAKRGYDEINYSTATKQPDGATRPVATDFQGNHAAGIIGALTNNRLGVAGINWVTQLYSSKILDGTKTPTLAVIRKAIDHIIELRSSTRAEQLVRAVAFGWSTTQNFGNPMPEFRRLVQGSLAAPDKGILVTVPAGDTGPLSINYPAAFKTAADENVLVVGATDANDRPWSGNSNVPRIDIYAPGVNIVSVGSAGSNYRTVTGTRQAAAHVSGAISLIYEAGRVNGQTLDWRKVKEAIINGADVVNGIRRLNLVGALQQLDLFKRPPNSGPVVTITGGQAAEGNAGISLATFTVAMDRAYAAPTTFRVRVADGTATIADRDYASVSPDGIVSVTIPAGDKSATFTARVIGDTRIEQNEVITATLIDLGDEVNVANPTATWTIVNDDAFPVVSIAGPLQFMEGHSGSTPARVAVKLSAPSPLTITVPFAITAGTATDAVDYRAVPAAGTLTFAPSQVIQYVPLTILGDRVVEDDETVTLTLSAPTNATLGASPTATVTIVDDELPVMSIGPAQVAALVNASNRMVFTVSLSTWPTAPVTVDFEAVDGTAVNGTDYTLAAGTISFAAGERVKPIPVTLAPRRAGEVYPKTFTARLFNVGGARLTGGGTEITATGRIITVDNTMPILTVATAHAAAVTGATGVMTFTVSLSSAPATPVTFDYAAEDGTALKGTDYEIAAGSLAFAIGERVKTFTVQVNPRRSGQVYPKTFTMRLSNVAGARLVAGGTETTAVGLIS